MGYGRVKRYLPVMAAYLLLACLLTWPLVTRLGSVYPTSEVWFGLDPNMYIWWMDWVGKILTGRLHYPPGMMVYWPVGVTPWAGYDGLLMLVVGVPVNLLTGNPILAYNLFILACFLAAAWCAYCLVWHLTGSRYAAALAGLIFGFSPYIMVRALLHPNLLMIFVVPLLALAAIKFLERPSAGRALGLGLAVLLAALSSWYYAIGGLVFLAIAAAWHWRTLWRHRQASVLAALLVAAALALPALPILLSDTGGGRPATDKLVDSLGARPSNLVMPHEYTNVFGGLTAEAYEQVFLYGTRGNAWESTSYLGAILIGMIAVFLWRRREWPDSRPWFWFTVALVLYILAMGNFIGVFGHRIPLPFKWLREIFPFSLVRAPNRFFVYTLMAVTVMSGYVLACLARRTKRFHLALFTVVLVALLLAERAIIPFYHREVKVPEFYRTIAADPEKYAIADLPIKYPGFSLYNQYQMTHGRPLVAGEYFYPAYSSRTFSYMLANPLLSASQCDLTTPITRDIDQEAVFRSFRDNDVRYLIVHNLILENDFECASAQDNIRRFFQGMDHTYADGDITVYEVPPAKSSS